MGCEEKFFKTNGPTIGKKQSDKKEKRGRRSYE
jgi:hypothetical protein